jgi:hypothetical protein
VGEEPRFEVPEENGSSCKSFAALPPIWSKRSRRPLRWPWESMESCEVDDGIVSLDRGKSDGAGRRQALCQPGPRVRRDPFD